MPAQVYLLDANTFMEAARRYYAFDLAPSFWNNLVQLAADGKIASIDRIKKQIEDGNDTLAQWIGNGNMANAFASTEQDGRDCRVPGDHCLGSG